MCYATRMAKVNAAAVDQLLAHHVVDVIDRAHLRTRLLRGEQLRVKLGIDPTAPDIHLGFMVVLRKLRAFQEAGHTAVLVIGDTTALIGDPTNRKKTRPPLSPAEIHANTETYLAQVGRVLDLRRAVVRRNSEWLSLLKLPDIIKLASVLTVAHVLERDDFKKRLKARAEVRLHELFYPLAQAYDSVAVRADVELGGTDQLWNILTGRELQQKLGQQPQDILTTALLVGLDGKEKMSKSLGNDIGITESPDSIIGKLMTIPDAVIYDYARLAANWSVDVLKKLPARLQQDNPRDVKLAVARDTVALYYGDIPAKQAAAEWLRIFHKKELPQTIPTKKLRAGRWDVVDLLLAVELASSKSGARRLVAQGGVRLNGARVSAGVGTISIEHGTLLQVGKRKFVRVV